MPSALATKANLKLNQYVARQPVMVDGSSIPCQGTATATIQLGPRQTTTQFYVILDIKEGILGMDALAELDLQIDTKSRRLLTGGHEVPMCEYTPTTTKDRPKRRLLRYGKVYAAAYANIPPRTEGILWGKVQTLDHQTTGTWTGIVEVVARLPSMRGLIGCFTLV